MNPSKEAGVPTGTASSYVANCAELLGQVMTPTRERLTPDPSELADTMETAPSRERVKTLPCQLVERMRRERNPVRPRWSCASGPPDVPNCGRN